MTTNLFITPHTLSLLATSLFFLLVSTSVVANVVCGPDGKSIGIAGSSTVRPVAELWATAYRQTCPNVGEIAVEGGGSSAGAGRVCANADKGTPVDIGDMSREWKLDVEAEVEDEANYVFRCLKGDTTRSAIQIDVAIDGLTVATQASGPGTDCLNKLGGLTIDQLRWIFSSYNDTQLIATGWDESALANSDGDESTHLWSELHPDCVQVEIKIAGADSESGTFEYFLETVMKDHENGEGFAYTGRPYQYFNSELDRDIVLYLESIAGEGIGYFGYAYYFENQQILDAAPIQNKAGDFIPPNPETVGDGTYNPLARRIFMNLHNDEESLEATAPFIRFGLSEEGTELVSQTGYVPLPDFVKADMLARLPELSKETLPSSAFKKSGAAVVAALSTIVTAFFCVWSV